MTHTRAKVKIKDHLVRMLEQKRMDGSNCITSCANTVGKNAVLGGMAMV